MELFKHPSKDSYVQAQILKNKKKLLVIASSDEELSVIARYVRTNIPRAGFGICHGVRNGYEVQRLRRLLGIEIIGTDIAPTATEFPNVIQWDFHDVKPEWIRKVDFIYSNSWDHSYDPEQLFKTWMDCLSPGGRLYISWTPSHSAPADGADCFSASLEELKSTLSRYGTLEADCTVRQWRIPGKSFIYNLARIVLRRKPVKTIHLLVVAHSAETQSIMRGKY